MARPRKVKIESENTEMVEIKDEGRTYVAEPTAKDDIEIMEATEIKDAVPEETVKMAEGFKPTPNKERLPTPICDIEELTDEDKQVLIEKKIKTIIGQTQVPYIPALVRYKEPGSTAVPPMFALVDYDHRFVNEGWEFYKTNVREPYVKDYLNLIAKLFNPHKIYTRLVQFNYE